MKTLFVLGLIAAFAVLGAVGTPAVAQGRWCAVYESAEGAQNCGFATRRQCMADLSGKGGFCKRNRG